MEHKLSEGLLLNEKGDLNEAGYAFDLVREYRRSDIKAGKSRIKEWDYYLICDDEYGIALTIDDNSYMGMASISVLDFKAKKREHKIVYCLVHKRQSWLPFFIQKWGC